MSEETLRRQDDGGPLGIFQDGRLIATAPENIDCEPLWPRGERARQGVSARAVGVVKYARRSGDAPAQNP